MSKTEDASQVRELRDEELEPVVGGSSGVHIPLVTISVREPAPEKHWFNGG